MKKGRDLLEASIGPRLPVAPLPITIALPAVPVPALLRDRPRDARGYLVPFFVAWVDGVPDFRCADDRAYAACIKEKLCWLCGKPLPPEFTFVIGPMCALNRNTAEPPCHRSCARYAVQVCPFLTKPRMRRNEKDVPDDTAHPGGVMIRRNPGVTLLWTTDSYRVYDDGAGKPLLRVGEPSEVQWWAEGRGATRGEVEESIRTGLPLLEAQIPPGDREAQALFDRLRESMKALVARSFAP